MKRTTLISCLLAGLLVLGVFAADAGAAPGTFGIESFEMSDSNLVAGAHPDLTTTFAFTAEREAETGYPLSPIGNVRNLSVELPVGLTGEPHASPQCTSAQLVPPGFIAPPTCPVDSQVGIATVKLTGLGAAEVPVFNMVPTNVEQTARFAFSLPFPGILVNIKVSVRTGSDYGLNADIDDISRPNGVSPGDTTLTLWGVPGAAEHNSQRFPQGFLPFLETLPPGNSIASGSPVAAFLTNPTTCGAPLGAEAIADSYQEPEVQVKAHSETATGVEGCEGLRFGPTITVKPTSGDAASPSGYAVDVSLPQNEDPSGRATSELRDTTVTLPEGVAISPSAADGLVACDDSQLKLGTTEAAACPAGSRLGSASFEVPALAGPLTGGIYLGRPLPANPYRLWLVGDGFGVHVKIPGSVHPDPVTGQLTTTFSDAPQVPIAGIHLRFDGGPRAALVNPPNCGTVTSQAVFTPWSGGENVGASSSFAIDRGPGGGACSTPGFAPSLSAGTVSPLAGAHSPFVVHLTRDDGSPALRNFNVVLPKGVLATLAGIPYCSDAALASASATSGAQQAASPSCPAASQIGTVEVGAGAGTNPFQVPGKAYLAGPYKGAPVSLGVVVPALAGPFDLGTVVVRAALRVNPETAQVTAVSDPLPTILEGIPLNIRSIDVNVDRANFTLNPTNCDPTSVGGEAFSVSGLAASIADRFQIGGCAGLAFEPTLKLKVSGATRRGRYPKLRAELRTQPGEANIGRVSVALPHGEFLAQEHIKEVCTRVQFAADACPSGSIYGRARAITPLLDKPLEGPVYLRSSSHKLPDLVAALNGQIDIDLDGKIDTAANGGIRNTFELVPDAPVSKFVLEMKGGKKSLLVNSENLCSKTGASRRAIVRFTGQNGDINAFKPKVANDCGKGKRK